MFDKRFENHDCPELTKYFLNAVMLTQTFMDDFSFAHGKSSIPLGRWHTNLHRDFKIMPRCEIVNLHIMMVSFIHKVLSNWRIKEHLRDKDLHQFIGNCVFSRSFIGKMASVIKI